MKSCCLQGTRTIQNCAGTLAAGCRAHELQPGASTACAHSIGPPPMVLAGGTHESRRPCMCWPAPAPWRRRAPYCFRAPAQPHALYCICPAPLLLRLSLCSMSTPAGTPQHKRSHLLRAPHTAQSSPSSNDANREHAGSSRCTPVMAHPGSRAAARNASWHGRSTAGRLRIFCCPVHSCRLCRAVWQAHLQGPRRICATSCHASHHPAGVSRNATCRASEGVNTSWHPVASCHVRHRHIMAQTSH